MDYNVEGTREGGFGLVPQDWHAAGLTPSPRRAVLPVTHQAFPRALKDTVPVKRLLGDLLTLSQRVLSLWGVHFESCDPVQVGAKEVNLLFLRTVETRLHFQKGVLEGTHQRSRITQLSRS